MSSAISLVWDLSPPGSVNESSYLLSTQALFSIAHTYARSMPVPLRQVGKDGPSVAALGFGLMGLSGAYGLPPSDEERFQILDHALELGATFWDSSE